METGLYEVTVKNRVVKKSGRIMGTQGMWYEEQATEVDR